MRLRCCSTTSSICFRPFGEVRVPTDQYVRGMSSEPGVSMVLNKVTLCSSGARSILALGVRKGSSVRSVERTYPFEERQQPSCGPAFL